MTGLYVHVPFCERKCFYCSFAVVVGQAHLAEDYVRNVLEEAGRYRGTAVHSVYIGGGTPSVLTREQSHVLAEGLRRVFCILPEAEITFEVNPESFSPEKAEALRMSGVNRISIGVQSFSDRYLRAVGRLHSSGQARQSVAWARAAGFDNISMDVMFSLPGQSLEEMLADVDAVTALQPEHVSLYQLNLEPHSRFFAQNISLADEESQARHYQAVCARLEAEGLKQYEVSNFSRPGRESQHNRNYWQGGDYIGLGSAAHAHRGGRRSWNVRLPRDYMRLIKEGRSPEEGCEVLDPAQRLLETVWLGLRMNEGVDLHETEKRFQQALPQEKKQLLEDLAAEGVLVWSGPRIRPTPKGMLVLDAVTERLMA